MWQIKTIWKVPSTSTAAEWWDIYSRASQGKRTAPSLSHQLIHWVHGEPLHPSYWIFTPFWAYLEAITFSKHFHFIYPILNLPASLNHKDSSNSNNQNMKWGTSLVVQWLRICLAKQETKVQSLVWKLRSHMPQGTKFPTTRYMATKTWCSQIN